MKILNGKSKIVSIAFLCVSLCLILCLASFASSVEYKGKIEPADATSQLLKYYVERFSPESCELIIDQQPDAAGRFRRIYMDIKGCNISGVRLDRLRFQMFDAQFNDPSKWASEEPECLSALEVYAECRLLEDDINADLKERVIGEDGDNSWRNLNLKISPDGLFGRGEYSFKLLFSFNILIEVQSKLRIVGGQEVWLEDTKLSLNRLDVPEYVTNAALGEIQPILNLKALPIPLKLHKVIFKDKEAVFESRKLPEKFEGINYIYTR